MKTIIITGASSGIGRETVAYFSERGWNVAATMRHPEQEVALTRLPNVKLFKLDVTSTDSVNEAVKAITSKYQTIDVLVNNAGFGLIGTFEGATEEQIHKQFETNVFGLMRLTKAILPIFRAQKSGRIINVSSIAGRMAFPIYSLYNSSKFAVEGFSEALSFELKPFNIKVKLIEPGPIKTNFNTSSKIDTATASLPDYKQYEEKANKFYDANFERAEEPIVVAKSIYKAATTRCNKLRYPAGLQAKAFTLLSKFIPRSCFRAITGKLTQM